MAASHVQLPELPGFFLNRWKLKPDPKNRLKPEFRSNLALTDSRSRILFQERQLHMTQILMYTHVVLDIYKQNTEEADVLVLLDVDRSEPTLLDDPDHRAPEVGDASAEVLRREVQLEVHLADRWELRVAF